VKIINAMIHSTLSKKINYVEQFSFHQTLLDVLIMKILFEKQILFSYHAPFNQK